MASTPKEPLPGEGMAPGRLLSIDALRGFDMFWIVGGEPFAVAWSEWAGWPPRATVEEQLGHARWEGFHFIDLVFPLFLFLVGVVLPFSLGKLRERGQASTAAYVRLCRRAAILFGLGLVYNGFLRLDFPTLRVAGVLQRIALCYLVAGLIILRAGVRVQVALVVALLLGYWALLATVPAPGFKAGDYSKAGNLAGYVDRHYLPGKLYEAYYGDGDNEGLLSTIPAVATALMGALAGQWLRSGRTPWGKVLGLTVAGAACVGLGHAWGFAFPIIKNLWTSSFALFAAGWSLLLLAVFYAVIDVLRFRRWAFPLVVIGTNAITIYLACRIVDFHAIAGFFLDGLAGRAGEFGPVLTSAGVLVVEWLALHHLYRNRIFLRA